MTDLETRTYEIVASDGRYRVEVPATWKITFGQIVPGKAGGSYGVRIWETENRQRLVIAGVESFRDISIPMQRLAVRKYGADDDEWYADGSRVKRDTVEAKWVDIDLVRDGAPPVDPKDPEETDPWARTRKSA